MLVGLVTDSLEIIQNIFETGLEKWMYEKKIVLIYSD